MILLESNSNYSNDNNLVGEEPHLPIVRPYMYINLGRGPEIPVDVQPSWYAESQHAVHEASREAYEKNRSNVGELRVNVVDRFVHAAARMRETDAFRAKARATAGEAYHQIAHPSTTGPSLSRPSVQTTEEHVPQFVREDAQNNLPAESIKPREGLLRKSIGRLATWVMQPVRPNR